jgi:hypothetical protein
MPGELPDDELFDESGSVEVPGEVMQECADSIESDAVKYEKVLLEHAQEYEREQA